MGREDAGRVQTAPSRAAIPRRGGPTQNYRSGFSHSFAFELNCSFLKIVNSSILVQHSRKYSNVLIKSTPKCDA